MIKKGYFLEKYKIRLYIINLRTINTPFGRKAGVSDRGSEKLLKKCKILPQGMV